VSDATIDPTVPAEVWEQEGSIGGADLNGRLPGVAIPVIVQGVAVVRDAPTLRSTFGGVAGVPGDSVQLVGYSPKRRSLQIVSSAPYRLCGSAGEAGQAGNGCLITTDAPISVPPAAAVWVRFEGTGFVGFIAGMDEG